jgi:Ran GTPase-activating protein (RanGAP) involved in mRNA processing and transport
MRVGEGLSARCEVLRLHSNEIGPSGATKLSVALPCSHVTVLDRTDNHIASHGATALSRAIGSGASLQRL